MKASECINIIEDRRFSTLVYQDGAVQTILAALKLLAATEGEEGTPEKLEIDGVLCQVDQRYIDLLRKVSEERDALLAALIGLERELVIGPDGTAAMWYPESSAPKALREARLVLDHYAPGWDATRSSQ